MSAGSCLLRSKLQRLRRSGPALRAWPEVDSPDCRPQRLRLDANCGSKGKRGTDTFAQLVESMKQMNEIVQGKRVPSRRFEVNAISVKKLRSKLGLSQPEFAALLHVDVGTLRNWEQGRREPTGPAKALLTAISRDPEHVLKALAA
jgi:putative transcriptional regulator